MTSKSISLGLSAFICTIAFAEAAEIAPNEEKSENYNWGIRIKADALYLKASTPSAAVAIQTLTHGGKTANGSVLELRSGMNWGCDIQLAYLFGIEKKAEVAAEWYNITSNWKQGPFKGTYITPTLGDSDQYSSVSFMTSSSHIGLNVFDLTIGKRYALFSHVELKPYGGLAGMIIQQRFKEVVNGQDVSQPTRNTSSNRMDGIGLMVGSCLDWNLGCGFSILGDAKFTLLYDYLHSRAVNYSITSPSTVHSSSTVSFNLQSYYMDLKAGIEWKHYFNHRKCLGGLGAGWKLSYFEKAWNIGGGGKLTNNNLGFQGLYLNAFLEF